MAYKLATAYVDIEARTAGVLHAFGSISGSFSGLLGSFGHINPIVEAVAALGALAFSIHHMMEESLDGTLALLRLQTAIRATGNVAHLTSDEVREFAEELQREGTFGDTAIIGATAKLVQMGVVTDKTYKDILRLSTDLARSGFGSVEHAAMMLGRALADPEHGLNRLRAAGIVFTETEKQQIKALSDANNTLAAQAAIMDKVRHSVGGLDAAFAKTPQGMWEQAKNDLASISQDLGNHIYPTAAALAKEFVKIAKAISEVVKPILDANHALGDWPLKLLIIAVAAKAATSAFFYLQESVLTNVASAMKLAGAMKDLWFGGMVPIMGGMLQLPSLLARVGMAWEGLVAAVTTGTLLTGWGAILVAVGAILAASVALFFYLRRFPKVNEAWSRAMTAVQMAFEAAWDMAKQLYEAFRPLIDGFLSAFINAKLLKAIMEDGLPGAAIFFANTLTTAILAVITTVNVLKKRLSEIAEILLHIYNRDLAKLGATLDRMKDKENFIGEWSDEFARLKAQLDARMKAAKTAKAPEGAAAGGGSLDLKPGLVGLQEAWRGVQEAILKRDDPQTRMADGIMGIEEIAGNMLTEQIKTNTILTGGAIA